MNRMDHEKVLQQTICRLSEEDISSPSIADKTTYDISDKDISYIFRKNAPGNTGISAGKYNPPLSAIPEMTASLKGVLKE